MSARLVLGLVVLLQVVLTVSAVLEGPLERVAISVAGLYFAVVIAVGIETRRWSQHTLGALACSGVTLFLAGAYAVSLEPQYAAIAVTFGLCTACCWWLGRRRS
ncbi:hypothetical protein C446_07252 [Halobiforma nitratireducens JCM 10879]|uniref:Uncharacterized protein n=2 Tax=Halobiforma nitratireducens TaxID=130048 RepID=M0M7J1_9EURY|nr:hypothetical protein C446_07252 [Halobiforma nitratireducens JCM 10879]